MFRSIIYNSYAVLLIETVLLVPNLCLQHIGFRIYAILNVAGRKFWLISPKQSKYGVFGPQKPQIRSQSRCNCINLQPTWVEHIDIQTRSGSQMFWIFGENWCARVTRHFFRGPPKIREPSILVTIPTCSTHGWIKLTYISSSNSQSFWLGLLYIDAHARARVTTYFFQGRPKFLEILVSICVPRVIHTQRID